MYPTMLVQAIKAMFAELLGTTPDQILEERDFDEVLLTALAECPFSYRILHDWYEGPIVQIQGRAPNGNWLSQKERVPLRYVCKDTPMLWKSSLVQRLRRYGKSFLGAHGMLPEVEADHVLPYRKRREEVAPSHIGMRRHVFERLDARPHMTRSLCRWTKRRQRSWKVHRDTQFRDKRDVRRRHLEKRWSRPCPQRVTWRSSKYYEPVPLGYRSWVEYGRVMREDEAFAERLDHITRYPEGRKAWHHYLSEMESGFPPPRWPDKYKMAELLADVVRPGHEFLGYNSRGLAMFDFSRPDMNPARLIQKALDKAA